MADDEAGNSFQHLLAPIRDLVANWNVDIAADLGDYLDALEGITFAIDGETHGLNFAEAALVIQGSASIYSKKVEYLHKMCHQALDFIADTQRKEAAAGEDGMEYEAERSLDDEIDAFLRFGDEIDEARNINLDMSVYKTVKRAPRPPAALVAQDDVSGNDGNESYKINQCVVHVTGALLLDRPDDFDTDAVLRTVHGDAQWANHATASSTAPGTFDPTAGAEVEEDDGWAYEDGGYDDNDAGGGLEGDTGGLPAVEGRTKDPEFVPEQHPDGGYDSDQQMGGVVAVVGQAKPIRKTVDPDFDPYAPLDPDDAGDAAAVKPFKKGATYKRMPNGAGSSGKRTTGGDERSVASVPAATARGLLFPEFEAAAKAVRDLQRKQRMAMLGGGGGRVAAKAAAAVAAVEATLFPGDADEYEDGFGGGWDDEGVWDNNNDDDDAGDLEGLVDNGSSALALTTGGGGSPMRPRALGYGGGVGTAHLSYEELCRVHVDAFVQAASAAQTQSELATRVSTWRQRVAPSLEAEDERPAFDIHSYAQMVLQRAAGERGELVRQPMAFDAIVAEQPRWKISRQFAAMLQMLNDGNLSIERDEGSWSKSKTASMDLISEFKVMALSLDVRHDAFGDVACDAFAGVPHSMEATAAVPALMLTDSSRPTATDTAAIMDTDAPVGDENTPFDPNVAKPKKPTAKKAASKPVSKAAAKKAAAAAPKAVRPKRGAAAR